MNKYGFLFFIISLFFGLAPFSFGNSQSDSSSSVGKGGLWGELDKASKELLYENIPDDTQISDSKTKQRDSSQNDDSQITKPLEDQVSSDQTESDQTSPDTIIPSQADKVEKEEKKRFSSTFGLQHTGGFFPNVKHISQAYFNGIYRFAESWSLSFSQAVDFHYLLNPNSDDKGIWLRDTVFLANKYFTNLPYKSRLKASVSSTLPLSHASQIRDTITVSTFYLDWRIKVDPLLGLQPHWLKDIVFFVKPITRYYFSEYAATRGGMLLPEFLFGIQEMGLNFNIRDYFSLSGSYGIWFISPYKTQFKRDEHSPFREHSYRYYYWLSLDGSVKINKQWKAGLSYSIIDKLNPYGYIGRTFLFDYKVSVWAFSLSYTFSFDSL